MDFEQLPEASPQSALEIWKDFGFSSKDNIFLQPTRIVPRKGIEHAIDLLAARANPSNKLPISHPAGYEGFGNALIEAFAFRKPILVDRYTVLQDDIEPLGFSITSMENGITPEVLAGVSRLLSDEEFRVTATNRNFDLAKEHLGFTTLRDKIGQLLS